MRTGRQDQKAYIIMDGQWGSCGKGLLAGYMARLHKPDVIVCNFGPNAGHTVILDKNEEKKIVTQQLPTGIVSYSAHTILIGPGAIINPAIFLKEVVTYHRFIKNAEIFIHPRAAIVTQFDLDMEENALIPIASTRKGVGASLANKIMRKGKPDHSPVVAAECPELMQYLITDEHYHQILTSATTLQIESAQGLELSINHGSSYPHCTSRDITVEAILNDVGLSYHRLTEVYVAMRTFPIRVGNEFDSKMQKIGDSGPVYPDMDELTWQQMSALVGMDIEERTTVTNKVRRVFTWSDMQFERMLRRIGPCSIFLNFMNYIDPLAPKLAGATPKARRFINHVNSMALRNCCRVEYLGWGPYIHQVEALDPFPY